MSIEDPDPTVATHRSAISGASLGFPRYQYLTRASAAAGAEVGAIYLAHDEGHARDIVLRMGTGSDAQKIERAFSTWVRFSSHGNVRTVYNLAISIDGHTAALEMAPVVETLSERIDHEQALALGDGLAVGLALSNALRELHSEGIAHGAIGPDSVVISADHQVQLSEIGFDSPEDPSKADFDADIRAVAQLVALTLGTAFGQDRNERLPGYDEPGGSAVSVLQNPEAVGPIPSRVTSMLTDVSLGRIPTAADLHQRFADLCRQHLGRLPAGIDVTKALDREAATASATPLDSVQRTPLGESHEDPRVADQSESGRDDNSPERAVSDGTDGTSPGGSQYKVAFFTLLAVVAIISALLLWRSIGNQDQPPAKTITPQSILEEVTIAPPTVAPPVSVQDTVPPPAHSPSRPNVKFVEQAVAEVSWQGTTSAEYGYIIRVAEFDVDPNTRTAVQPPRSSSWIDRNGIRSGADDLDPLPPGTSNIRLTIPDLNETFTCFRPVAISARRTIASQEQVCVPSASPSSPAITYPATSEHAPGSFEVNWTDNSNDESHFTLLEIDPESQTVSDFAQAPADSTTIPWTLSPESISCFMVRAENAFNRDLRPNGTRPDGSSSTPSFCVSTIGQGS